MHAIYDQIGSGYNKSRQADSYLTHRLIDLLSLNFNGTYLDIGCGTGNYTHALADLGFRMIGMDPSIQMLTQAKQRPSIIEWSLGRAENTGIRANEMDGVIATLTLHHWDSLTQGFMEMKRILKPGGRMVIFTSTPEQMRGYWLNHYFPKMMEDSCKQMPTLQHVEESLESAALSVIQTEQYFVKPDLEDLFLYSCKHRPHLYLDPQVRNGVSSFSSLSNAEEVAQGLKELAKDIDSGKIHERIKSFENELGDYLFIIAEKETDGISI